MRTMDFKKDDTRMYLKAERLEMKVYKIKNYFLFIRLEFKTERLYKSLNKRFPPVKPRGRSFAVMPSVLSSRLPIMVRP